MSFVHVFIDKKRALLIFYKKRALLIFYLSRYGDFCHGSEFTAITYRRYEGMLESIWLDWAALLAEEMCFGASPGKASV
jgi:hypothetical protein